MVESLEVLSGFRQKNVQTLFAQGFVLSLSEYAGSSPGERSSTNTQHCGVKLAVRTPTMIHGDFCAFAAILRFVSVVDSSVVITVKPPFLGLSRTRNCLSV